MSLHFLFKKKKLKFSSNCGLHQVSRTRERKKEKQKITTHIWYLIVFILCVHYIMMRIYHKWMSVMHNDFELYVDKIIKFHFWEEQHKLNFSISSKNTFTFVFCNLFSIFLNFNKSVIEFVCANIFCA